METKLLIVDDTPENLDVLRQVLSPLDCKILVANSGERSLDIIARNQPDLVLLDVMMPGMDGFEVCRRIRANESTAETPVIFVTARQDDIAQGFAVGGNDYITKPISMEEVQSRVRHQLERVRLIRELKTLNEELEEKVRERTAKLAIANRQLREEVNERRFMQDRLRYLAEHDFVTRVYNRNALDAHVTEVIDGVQRKSAEAVYLQIDIDQFRLVNESCGCIAGDELLKEVGEMLGHCLSEQDFLARLGGDKFAIVAGKHNRASGLALANLIQQQANNFAFVWEGREFKLALTIALVVVDKDVSSFEQLLLMADEVMYLAKKEGRSTVRVYDEDTLRQTSHRSNVNWALRLVDALNQDHFCIHVQRLSRIRAPGENLPAKLKLEALVRLRDTSGSLMFPDSFIPAAERFNLISQIDRWMIKRVVQILAQHPECHDEIEHIAINLSAISIRERDLGAYIERTLAQYKVPGHLIAFEITETENIVNLEETRQFIRDVKNLGCQFALDDFGSGYASFNYLRELPFDQVKIDGVFIRDIDKIETNISMVKSIVEIAQKLNVSVVAEFVENNRIHTLLDELGVDWGQGYHYHRPEELTNESLKRMIKQVA